MSMDTHDQRSRIQHAIAHLEHVLPAQASIRDFVHHNTLHGFQHLAFPDALRAARELTGIRGYPPEAFFRERFAAGRIARADLEAVLREAGVGDEALFGTRNGPLRRIDAQIAALAQGGEAIGWPALNWRIEELQATADAELWSACLEALGLGVEMPHPEGLVDIETDHAALGVRAEALWQSLAGRLGRDLTLRGLLRALSGEDILDAARPMLLRHLAGHLDLGLAAWTNPRRAEGFYAAWRESSLGDAGLALDGIGALRRDLAEYPEDATDAVLAELTLRELPEERWAGYLERLALELPGWSGMFLWRAQRPGYAGTAQVPVAMADYLAVRLILERAYAEALTQRLWKASPPALAAHFRTCPAELLVRHAFFGDDLPEYLRDLAGRRLAAAEPDAEPDWAWLAGRIEAWRAQAAEASGAGRTVAGSAWPLYLLARNLGLAGAELREAGQRGVEALADCLERFDEDARGYLWLQAYERRYREEIFAALAANHGRAREPAAAAQLVFCMDDREEGMRRHLEAINPALQTFGVAAHFGVFQNWRGLDDAGVTPLCPVVPVVVKPAHEVREAAREAGAGEAHRRRRAQRAGWRDWLLQGTRVGLLSGVPGVLLAAPWALAGLLMQSLAPARQARWMARLRAAFDGAVPTRLTFVAQDASAPATPEAPRLGFTDLEAADRVAPFLRAMGLARDFAPLVVILGHGSNSRNNPHLAAYDCGACAGRHSGPNARLFAAMANRAEVRALMAEKGIAVPPGTWFLGAEHNTCDDAVTWYDLEDVPTYLRGSLRALQEDLAAAGRAHAQERCRRLASAPLGISQDAAWAHVAGRRADIAQARPELGHATNACAFIGRRTMSRGAFFDRRSFLISYDPTLDADGAILERLLLANGPVGAGIALEYYFSTANNERFGCGSKIVHNVAGYFGVMEGAGSDLRTGLPLQMVEIHEPMRLLVVVEAKIDIVTAIYRRQPPLQELIGQGWIVVAAKDPDAPEIHLFDPVRGWLRWTGEATTATAATSRDWFAASREPLAPVLLEQPA